MRISAKEIEIAVGGQIISDCKDGYVESISTDTREACENSLFVPLIGLHFDGHKFIGDAYAKGASICLTEQELPTDMQRSDRTLIRVENTLAALGKLAAWYRLRFNPLVVGITGSSGKTTTKEMISLVLSKKYNVLKTQGSKNNEIGLPMTIFGLNETHDAMVLEMGMNMPGEISRLSKIARPDAAVITNIGMAHVGRFGTKQNILKAKMEIMEGLSKSGTVYLNGDDILLHGLMGLIDRQIVYFGIDENLDIIGTDIRVRGDEGITFEFQWRMSSFEVALNVAGAHNVYNALAAVAVGLLNNISPELIVSALSEYRPDKLRMNIRDFGGIKVINDAYNANPQSMQAALDVLSIMDPGRRKIAVLGDMMELGDLSAQCHRDIGAYAASKNIDMLITVGEQAKEIAAGLSDSGAEGIEIASFESRDQATEILLSSLQAGDIVLVKGSRGMQMEKIAALVEEQRIGGGAGNA